ncbi:murein hydrolase activator EnvC [Paraferrimonas sp. SM1919]|uniref:murein hydrolase activator EnvC family protein n=1 Tax=Paraferrimonas sp. SM1919 TaxID=2662263 RepID=UPI0013D5032F|nr:peptidoglycan DD-metalloendopeptidase family protein [Paraferrimonas sp. SM1919]
MRLSLLVVGLCAGLIAGTANGSDNADLKQRQLELEQIKLQIAKQQASISNRRQQHKKLLALLKKDEKAVARVAKKLSQSKDELTQIKKAIEVTRKEILQLEDQMSIQQQQLISSIRSAYKIGSHSFLQLLLEQQQVSQAERFSVYYQALSQARSEAIDKLQETENTLYQRQQQQSIQQAKLQNLVAANLEQSQQLKLQKSQREKTLKQLQSNISSSTLGLEQLEVEQASLQKLITDSLQRPTHFSGLAKSAGKLSWPVSGNHTNSFGSKRSAQVKWKGINISAKEGTPVKVIADGVIIFSDWMNNFGMMTVVDHGEGYMSLYAHAQALLGQTGARVKKGDTIALVGNSGGKSKAGLYFELRHKGQAVNPSKYCK